MTLLLLLLPSATNQDKLTFTRAFGSLASRSAIPELSYGRPVKYCVLVLYLPLPNETAGRQARAHTQGGRLSSNVVTRNGFWCLAARKGGFKVGSSSGVASHKRTPCQAGTQSKRRDGSWILLCTAPIVVPTDRPHVCGCRCGLLPRRPHGVVACTPSSWNTTILRCGIALDSTPTIRQRTTAKGSCEGLLWHPATWKCRLPASSVYLVPSASSGCTQC